MRAEAVTVFHLLSYTSFFLIFAFPAPMNLAFRPRTLNMNTKQAKQQVIILDCLHAVSPDFSDEFPVQVFA